MTIELGSGRRIRVDSDVDTEALGRIPSGEIMAAFTRWLRRICRRSFLSSSAIASYAASNGRQPAEFVVPP